jgi:hypothetical protein
MTMPEDCVTVEPDMPVSSDDAGQGGGSDGSTGVSGYGCATPGGVAPGEPGVDDDWDRDGYYVEPAYCRPTTDDTMVVGRWSVKDGSLAIDVRYTSYWGEYICDYPTPGPYPEPEPDTSMGAIYGRIEVGPLCPVEPCEATELYQTFEGKYLVLESSETGEERRLEITPDGWFKDWLPVGVYKLTMPDCPWMGCDSVFPTEVRVAYDVYDEVVIRIDTGIR